MPDFPASRQAFPKLSTFHSGGFCCPAQDAMRMNASNFAAGTVNQNRAYYVTFMVGERVTAYQMAWENGVTSNGNVDVGIYNEVGTKLVSSGSTAQGTVSVVQSVDITDTVLPPGTYFMALASDSATATFMRSIVDVTWFRLLGTAQQQDTAFPLPSSATMTTVASSVAVPALAVMCAAAV